jgi:hypothetical protein
MKKILVAFILFSILIGCNSNKKSSTKLSHFIPENTTTVLKISDFQSFKNDLRHNDFATQIYNKHLQLLDTDLLKNLKTIHPVLLCFSTAENNKEISIITTYNDSLYADVNIDSTSFFYKIIDSIYIASTSKNIIDNLQPKPHLEFEKLAKTTNANASFSLYLNQKSTNCLGQALLDQKTMAKAFMLDASLTSGELNLNGIAIKDFSRPDVLSIFNHTTPQENTLFNIAPHNSKGILSFTFNNYDIIKSNIENYTKTKIDSTLNDFWLHSINEIGEVFLDNSSVIIAKSLDPITTKDGLLEHQDIVFTYREINILQFNTPKYFKSIFYPLLSDVEPNFYVNLGDYFVFAHSELDLQTIISHYQNGSTLNKNQALLKSNRNISDESSLLLVANSDKLEDISTRLT